MIGSPLISRAPVNATGNSQATATQLSALFNAIMSGTDVSVPPALGQMQVVFNQTANNVNVWPCVGAMICPLALNTAHVITPGQAIGIFAFSDTLLYRMF